MRQTVLLQKVHSSGGETIHFFQVIIFKTNLKEGYSKYILIFFHSTHLLSFGLCWIFSQKLYLIDIHHEQVFPGQITSLPPSKRYRLKPGWKGKSWSTLSPRWCQNLEELRFKFHFVIFLGGRIWRHSWTFPRLLFPCIVGWVALHCKMFRVCYKKR